MYSYSKVSENKSFKYEDPTKMPRNMEFKVFLYSLIHFQVNTNKKNTLKAATGDSTWAIPREMGHTLGAGAAAQLVMRRMQRKQGYSCRFVGGNHLDIEFCLYSKF